MKSRKPLKIIGFKPEKRKDKNSGEMITENVPILVEFKFDGQRVIYPIGYRIDFNKWNFEEQRVKRNNMNKNGVFAGTINSRITFIEEQLPIIYNNALSTGQEITKKYIWTELNERIKGKENISDEIKITKIKKVVDYIDEFIETESKTKNWAEGTKKKVVTFRNRIEVYSPNLVFSDVTVDFLTKFIEYLRDNINLNNTTCHKYLKIFKWFLGWSVKLGYNNNLDYQKLEYKFKGLSTNDSQKNVFFLNWQELIHFYNFDFSQNLKLERVRDVYCFCCFTSLRYSDIANLKKSDFKIDSNGFQYLNLLTIKTDDGLTIELNKYTLELWEKYKDIDITNNIAFPAISNQKFNNYLKEATRLAGFNSMETKTVYKGNERITYHKQKWEFLTSHTARKTFIINALDLGIQRDIIKKWTGHKNHESMEVYIKIVNEKKREAMNKFNLK